MQRLHTITSGAISGAVPCSAGARPTGEFAVELDGRRARAKERGENRDGNGQDLEPGNHSWNKIGVPSYEIVGLQGFGEDK